MAPFYVHVEEFVCTGLDCQKFDESGGSEKANRSVVILVKALRREQLEWCTYAIHQVIGRIDNAEVVMDEHGQPSALLGEVP